MDVLNLVYTKVSPDETPWRKTGFHTVFYPTALMTKDDIFELEQRIHFPGTEKLGRKQTVFYQSIQGEYHLVILHIQSLPDAKDTFGRGGIFLCHGFIFPPELWQKVPMPLSLFELAEQNLFTTREQVLASPSVNKKTGDIQPLEISKENLSEHAKKLPRLTTDFERRLVMLLNRLANMADQVPVVILKGEPDTIAGFLNQAIAYVPDNLKITLGWDPVFEAGNLAFYPLKIVGFKSDHPMGGSGDNIVEINMETLAIYDSDEFFAPHTLYENWLNSCHEEADSKDQIEKAYKLSLMIEKGQSFASDEILDKRTGFAYANKARITEIFLGECQKIVGKTFAQHVGNSLDSETMLDLLTENLPSEKMALEIREFAKIEKIMFDGILRQNKQLAIFRQEISLVEILENILKQGLSDNSEMKKLISWAKKRIPVKDDFPYIKAFLYPKHGIPDNMKDDEAIKERLIECFIQCHKYKIKDFEKLGFDKYELLNIEKRLKSKTLKNKFKRIIMRSGNKKRP